MGDGGKGKENFPTLQTRDVVAEKVGNKIAFNVVYSEEVAINFSTVTVLATVKGNEWELQSFVKFLLIFLVLIDMAFLCAII